MPLFEYACRACGHPFEVLLRSPSAAPGACPACGSRRVERQLSVFAAAGNTLSDRVPCAAGSCPTAPGGRSPCSTGSCPFG